MDCKKRLKVQMLKQLKLDGNSPIAKALAMKDSEVTRQELKKIMTSENSFIRLKAASSLAAFGFIDGIHEFISVTTMTNSQIEFFYAKASLILLDQSIPEQLKNKNSVFRELNDLLTECLIKPS